MQRLAAAVLVALCLVVVRGQYDETIQPGAKGEGVVKAVCSRIETSCIFNEDKLLLRRIAFVESHDGNDADTFRSGYFGGIWQVNKAAFDNTQNLGAPSDVTTAIDKIRDYFGIVWATVRWDDLTKPLYSALAARLYIAITSGNIVIPRSIPDQAVFWQIYYHPSGAVSEYTTKANQLEQGCKAGSGADIVFVIDASGSIGADNFILVKKFIIDAVNSFDVGPGVHQHRIGLVKFSSDVMREFDLNTYTTKSEIVNHVTNMFYTAGGTSTHLGLDEMTERAFTAVNGVRPKEQGHPRVGIVVTDGKTNDPSLLPDACNRAHAADITVIAVGVGSGINIDELKLIASTPICLHLILLANFTEFDSLKSIIEQRTCEAPIIISPGQNPTTPTLPPGGVQNCKIRIPAEGATMQLETNQGVVRFYIAEETFPSGSFYVYVIEAKPGVLGVMYIPKSGGANVTTYCNFWVDSPTETNVTVGCEPGNKDYCNKLKPCQNGGTCSNTKVSYDCDCHPYYTGDKCETRLPWWRIVIIWIGLG